MKRLILQGLCPHRLPVQWNRQTYKRIITLHEIHGGRENERSTQGNITWKREGLSLGGISA